MYNISTGYYTLVHSMLPCRTVGTLQQRHCNTKHYKCALLCCTKLHIYSIHSLANWTNGINYDRNGHWISKASSQGTAAFKCLWFKSHLACEQRRRTGWAGKAAPLHRERVIPRPEHEGLEGIGELLHSMEVLVPALQHKLVLLLKDPELFVCFTVLKVTGGEWAQDRIN